MRVTAMVSCLILLALLSTNAQATVFGVVDQFLVGGRASGLGGAYTAVAEGPYAVDWNPAACGSNDGTTLGFYQREAVPDLQFQDVRVQALGVTHGNGVIGVGLFRSDVHQGQTVDSSSGRIEENDQSNIQVGLGISLSSLLSSGDSSRDSDLSVGVNVKHVRVRAPGFLNESATAIDVGLLARTGQSVVQNDGGWGQFRAGIVFDDLLEAEDSFGDAALASRALRLGAAWDRRWEGSPDWYRNLGILLVADYLIEQVKVDLPSQGNVWGVGAEIGWVGLFHARVGYIGDDDGDVTDWTWSVTADLARSELPMDVSLTAGQLPQASGLDRVWFFGATVELQRN